MEVRLIHILLVEGFQFTTSSLRMQRVIGRPITTPSFSLCICFRSCEHQQSHHHRRLVFRQYDAAHFGGGRRTVYHF